MSCVTNPLKDRPSAYAEAVPRLEFSYDYQGRRVSKTVYSWSGTNWVEQSESTFVYDGWNLISETCDIQTLGLSTNLYVWGLDLSGSFQGAGGIGGLLFRSDGGTSSVSSVSYVFDANGNVSELLTDAGEIAAHYVEAKRKSDCRRKYDPYGNTLVSEGELASDNVYRFSTKYTDTETKLLYYGFRYYSPSMGRWLSRDPIEEKGGLNLYVFLQNDVIRRVDPYGNIGPSPLVITAIVNATKILKDCLIKLIASDAEARKLFSIAEQSYRCCVEGDDVDLKDFPGVVSGTPVEQYGVQHCFLGYVAKRNGIGTHCLDAANTLWELWEVVYPKYWEWRPSRNGAKGWLKDTISDMQSIINGQSASSLQDCIPSQCCFRNN